jgi:copper chaperone CopZ|tara:strand:- start:233 stop:568 length:336 start_codon:yes stop_codon:yes gene_type:complete
MTIKTVFNILIAGLLISCSGDTKTVDLELESMQCLSCSMAIEDILVDLDGVEKVAIDLKNKSGKVTYKASVVNMEAIEKVIVAIGYNVNDKKADPEAYANLEICCKKPEDQ